MEIILNKENTAEPSIKINLKENDYKSKVEKKIKEYTKKIDIKGFRKGKIPLHIIKSRYGKPILIEEINQLISQGISNFIKDNKLSIIGEPIPKKGEESLNDFDNQKDFEFNYAIGLISAFEVELSKKQTFSKNEIIVDQKIIDRTLIDIKSQYPTITNPDISSHEDSIDGTFSQHKTNFSSIGTIDLKQIDKENCTPFITLKKGDKVTFDPHKVFTSPTEIAKVLGIKEDEVKNLNGEVQFEVKTIIRKTPAEINTDLFDKIFGKDAVKDEKSFLEKIEKTIAFNFEKETKHLLERDIKHYFLANVEIKIPIDFLKDWIFISNKEKITREQIERDLDSYIAELKWNLIRNKIASSEKIEVSENDVKSRAAQIIAEQFGSLSIIEQLGEKMNEFVDKYLKANNGENYSSTYNQILHDRAYALIIDKITISTKKIAEEDFKKLALA